jgi:hypothetical protein
MRFIEKDVKVRQSLAGNILRHRIFLGCPRCVGGLLHGVPDLSRLKGDLLAIPFAYTCHSHEFFSLHTPYMPETFFRKYSPGSIREKTKDPSLWEER